MALPMVKSEDPSENTEKLCSHCGLHFLPGRESWSWMVYQSGYSRETEHREDGWMDGWVGGWIGR